MEKAKRFQPLAVLNQKLKGLDVFESNENLQSSAGPSRPPGPVPVVSAQPAEIPRAPEPEDIITKEHWQPRGFYDVCLEPSCGQRLNATNGCVNCRKCGKLFCEEHTMYQMRLSRSAQHEPVRGLWYRVCETCYKSREGYNDHNGAQLFSLLLLGVRANYRRRRKRSNGRVPSCEEANCRQSFLRGIPAGETSDTSDPAPRCFTSGPDPVRRD